MEDANRIISELSEIKKLIMLQLINDGIDAKTLGRVLGVTPTRIRQIIPVKQLKK